MSLVKQIKEWFASDSSRSFRLFVLRDTLQSYNSLKKYQNKIHELGDEAEEIFQQDVVSFAESLNKSFEQALSPRNWKGLHDELASLSNTMRIVSRGDNSFKPFKYNDADREVECEIDGFTFLLPKNGMDLARLGSIFHNCVGNYSSYVHNGECIIVYAKKGEEYRLCIELSKENGEYKANQIKSFYNKIPRGEDAEVALKWLELFDIPSNNCRDVQRMMNPSAKVDYSYANVNDLVDDDLPF